MELVGIKIKVGGNREVGVGLGGLKEESGANMTQVCFVKLSKNHLKYLKTTLNKNKKKKKNKIQMAPAAPSCSGL